MGQEGYSLDVAALHRYSERWLGPEREGTQPQAAFLGGRIDPWQMLFVEPQAHTEKSRAAALPHRRTCAPYKDPKCWRRQSKLLMETCEYCCSPFEHKGGRGADICWDDEYTFDRCCHDDFKDLICELERKGEEGGCVDCKKTVVYKCLTPPEKHLQDAQNKYNAKVDIFNKLQEDSQKVAQDIAETKQDLMNKDAKYRELHAVYNEKLQIWHTAYNNETRLISDARLQQQKLTWNASGKALQKARSNLQKAQNSTAVARTTLQKSRQEEDFGRQILANNRSIYDQAVVVHEQAMQALDTAKEAQREAQQEFDDAVSKAQNASESAVLASSEAKAANLHREEEYSRTQAQLQAAEAVRDASRQAATIAADNDAKSLTSLEKARNTTLRIKHELESAAAQLSTAQGKVAAANQSIVTAGKDREVAEEQRLLAAKELRAARDDEALVHAALTNETGTSTSVLCLISKTRGNGSARPQMPKLKSGAARHGACLPKDKNEFCAQWAEEGECERNSNYMLKVCELSCAGRGIKSAQAPACSQDVPLDHQVTAEEDALKQIISKLVASSPVAREAALRAETELSNQARNDSLDAEGVIAIPAKYELAITVAGSAVTEARGRQQSTSQLIDTARAALNKAKLDHTQAAQNEASMKAELGKARANAQEAGLDVNAWENLVSRNQSIVEHVQRNLTGRQDAHRKAQKAADKASTLEKGLMKAFQLAEDSATQKRQTAVSAKKAMTELEDHVRTLNSSLSENLTTLVSAWLLQQNAGTQASRSGRWSERLLAAAKSVLVKMVGSVESFLENYVISLSDRDSVVELVKTLDDQKSAELQWIESERAAEDAELQATDARTSLSKAEAARQKADEAVVAAAAFIPPAEQEVQAAEAALKVTQEGLRKVKEFLKAQEDVILRCEANLEGAANSTLAAAGVIDAKERELKIANLNNEVAKAEVTQALASVTAAKENLTNAHAELLGGSLTQIKNDCSATEQEFETYKEFRAVISLARYIAEKRLRVDELAEAHLARRISALNHSHIAAANATAELADRQEHKRELELNLTAADSDLHTKEAERNVTAVKASEAEGQFQKDQAEVDVILSVRGKADNLAKVADSTNQSAFSEMHAADNHRDAKAQKLNLAVNLTQNRTEELTQAYNGEADMLRLYQHAKEWQAAFNASLMLDDKENVLSDALAEERKRIDLEAQASRREARMHILYDTHVKHLMLVDTENEVPQKEQARNQAKMHFDAAEKDVVDAQAKLDAFVKSEAETHENIHKTYKELGELKEEHSEAQKEHDEQDPEDRKRSFTSALER
eukprot:TRINITY_DN57843_c0_g1_i1.p1 TRINITY_DN57843_c0_g1~~TRINITY_DN57843_c0_g1_i1.p1  ORF type:complete len:1339 (+),score=308.62 TRINITY_DN57843_c0_g1_i1:99-4019(+)